MAKELCREVQRYLILRALPELSVEVAAADERTVELEIEVRVNGAAHPPDEIVLDVQRVVTHRFSRSQRRIGQPIHLGEIYGVVEAVAGVADSECRFAAELPSGPNRVLYIAGPDAVACTHVEYQP